MLGSACLSQSPLFHASGSRHLVCTALTKKAIAVLPEKSDNPVTMSINQWAAEIYAIAQAHLEAAKALDGAVSSLDSVPSR